jgi:hypothetical protein
MFSAFTIINKTENSYSSESNKNTKEKCSDPMIAINDSFHKKNLISQTKSWNLCGKDMRSMSKKNSKYGFYRRKIFNNHIPCYFHSKTLTEIITELYHEMKSRIENLKISNQQISDEAHECIPPSSSDGVSSPKINNRLLLSPTIIEKDTNYLIERFQGKFKNVEKELSQLFDYILEKIKKIDENYQKYDYFGLKKRLISQILNIFLSYIIYEGYIILNNDHQKIPMTDKIKLFIDKLIEKMDIISKLKDAINFLDKVHCKYLKDESEIYSLILKYQNQKKHEEEDPRLKPRPSRVEGALASASATSHEEDPRLKPRPSHEEDPRLKPRPSHEEDTPDPIIQKYIKYQNNLQYTINEIITTKENTDYVISKVVDDIFDIIDFNYFVHADWFPSLNEFMISKLEYN